MQIHAYQVMGQVQWVATVRAHYSDLSLQPDTVLRVVKDVEVDGELEPHDWLRDLLVAVAEHL